MTNKPMETRRISQICFAANDIDRVLKGWVDLMNVGPWLVLTSSPATIANVMADNRPLPPDADFRSYCALAELGNAQLEVNQPLFGDEALPAFLAKNGNSWHHFKEHIEPAEKVLETGLRYLREKNLDIVSYGEIDLDRYLNVGTYEALGANLELGNTGRISFPPEYQRNYPAPAPAGLAEKSRKWYVTELTFVTDDLDRALDNWQKLIGVGPWEVSTVTEKNLREVVIEGKPGEAPFSYRRAMVAWGDKFLEVVQPRHGLPVFQEYAEKSSRGMHSVVFYVAPEEFDEKVALFAKRGVANRFGGRIGDVRFASLDTEKILGCRIVLGTGKSNRLEIKK